MPHTCFPSTHYHRCQRLQSMNATLQAVHKSTPNDPHSAQLMPHNDPLNGKSQDLLHIQSCKHTEMGREKKSDFTIGATDRRPQVRNQGGTMQGNHNCMFTNQTVCFMVKSTVLYIKTLQFPHAKILLTLTHCKRQ